MNLSRPTARVRFTRLLHVLELARFDLVLSTVSGVWLMIFLAWALEPPARQNPALAQLGLPLALLLGAVVSAGLSGCGMALNDVLDARHDRAFAPTRPIPTGRVDVPVAVAAAMLSLLVALAAALLFGHLSALLGLLAAAGIIFYNLTGRFVPSVGVLTIGLLQALIMLIPNPQLSFAWPILLAMMHVMACAALRHWVSAKRPQLSGRDGSLICVGSAFWCLLVVALMRVRSAGELAGEPQADWLPRWVWVGPTLAAAALLVTVGWMLRDRLASAQRRRDIAPSLARVSAVWLILYDVSWLGSAGLWWQCLVLAGLLGAAVGLGQLQEQGSVKATAPPATA